MDGRPDSRIRRWFLGTDGLRAGWSLLLFLLVLGILAALANLAAAPFFPRHGMGLDSAATIALGDGALAAAVAGATWALAFAEGRPLAFYGFGGARGGRRFLEGGLWGLGSLALLVLVLRAAGLLAFRGPVLAPEPALAQGLRFLLAFLLVALFEEGLMRGFVQATLARGLAGLFRTLGAGGGAPAAGFWAAALLLSALFGLGHGANPGESPLGLLVAALVGLLLCYSLRRSGSLLWALGFHMAWDWAQTFLFGAANSGTRPEGTLLWADPRGPALWSGGATGPEGSLLALPVLLLVALGIRLTLDQRA